MKRLTKKQSKIRALTAYLLENVEESGLFSQMELNYIHARYYALSDHLEEALSKESEMIERGSWKTGCLHQEHDQIGHCTACGEHDVNYDDGYG